ncbi:unnamed protein product [Schistosoma rodhaini]|uniref:Uncharacterized protein n=1 Tax=Schistosoma rodhaini TaxID=6188 RepID=A0AA85G985_9TREM|nr:unnamed protein product [Schistosoma rodhaini]
MNRNIQLIFKKCEQSIRFRMLSSSSSSFVYSPSSSIPPHIPIMKSEIIKYTQPKPGQVYLDMTFGTGGHANEILKYAGDNLTCYFLDRDPTSLSFMESLRKNYSSSNHKIYPLIGRFSDLPQLLNGYDLKYQSVDLILMDLGVSSPQLDIESRGFGFKHNAPLDMRMNQSPNVQKDTPTAADVINTLNADELSNIFSIYGEERLSKRIANAIIDYRNDVGSIQTTKQLADLIHSVVPMNREGRSSIHPATRVFQALRIFINDELNELCIGLELAEFLLKPGGYLVVLSFHSLEDRLVKWSFHSDHKHLTLSKYLSQRSRHFQCLNKRQEYEDDEISKESLGQIKSKWNCVIGPITPSDSEIDSNPRSRSAKLRIAKRA